MVCHIVNITGHILPVKKIGDMAHRHGVEVIVDRDTPTFLWNQFFYLKNQ